MHPVLCKVDGVNNTIRLVTALVYALCITRGNCSINLTAKPERTVLPDTASDCILQIELEGDGDKEPSQKRKTPLNLAVVLDRSGSMSGAKIEKARQAACMVVDQLGKDDQFSLIIYDTEVEVLIPSAKVTDKENLQRRINRIEPGGSTALYAGVEAGAKQVRKYFETERINRVILLSDGLANVGPKSPNELAVLGRQLSKEKISVSTIGLGDDFNEDLMTALAESGHGNYYYVQDAENLPRIFSDELGMVKSIVAREIKLKITLPEGIHARGILGDDEIQIQGGTVIIPLPELSSTQKRRFLLDCQIAAGDLTRLANIDLEYVDPASGDVRHETLSVNAKRTNDAKKSEASIQAEVLSNTAITRNRIAKEKAVALNDAGKSKEAAELLRRQAAANAALPAAAQSKLLREEQQSLESRAAELESRGTLNRAALKSLKYENYRDKKQRR